MKVVGIIVEYNPFHNGHLYHIEKIKELFPDSIIVAVMSGNFTQHGDVSILNKWDKTELALTYGVDLVVELPFAFATQSADVFARASIEILTHLQVDTLVFGSESNNIDMLKELATIQLNNKKYDKLVEEYLSEGINYPTALSKALFTISGKKIDKPNDILGLSYIREIIKQKSPIEPICIKRNNDFNSKVLNDDMTSATSIRYALSQNDDVSNYVPFYTQEKLKGNLFFTKDYFSLLKYKLLTDLDLSIYQTIEEGIENRFLKYIVSSKSMDEFLLKIKTKRYTYSKLMRMFTHILVNYTKEEAENFKSCEYIRILGFNQKGKEHLNKIKNNISIPLVVRFASLNHPMLKLEYRATCVYASILDEKEKEKLIEAEYKNGPIIH
jgi:cytidyltransferase-like protein